MQIALVAHQRTRPDLVRFARSHRSTLEDFDLVATGTTQQRLIDAGLDVQRREASAYGGDVTLAAEVADGTCDAVIFLRDVLTTQAHEPDTTALLRICDVHETPVATNVASAEHVLAGLAADATAASSQHPSARRP